MQLVGDSEKMVLQARWLQERAGMSSLGTRMGQLVWLCTNRGIHPGLLVGQRQDGAISRSAYGTWQRLASQQVYGFAC